MSNVQTGELLSFHDYSPELDDIRDVRDHSARIDVEAVHAGPRSSASAPPQYQPQPQYSFDDQSTTAGDDAPVPTNHNFWTIEYYQKYFDVQTSEVVERIISSVVPQKVSSNYFDERIKGKPDLYGPIWISITLVFTIAVSGNIANYLQYSQKNISWRYNFHLLSIAATAIFCYVWIVPLALWAVLKWSTVHDNLSEAENQQPETPTMMSLFCLYGYSLSIYVPVAILWTIQVTWLQWLFVMMAALVSGLVLIFWLLPALRKSKYFILLAVAILLFHFLLASGFMIYFFKADSTMVTHVTGTPVPQPQALPATNATVIGH